MRSKHATKKPEVLSARGSQRMQYCVGGASSPSDARPRVVHVAGMMFARAQTPAISSFASTARTTASFSRSCTEHVEYTTRCAFGKHVRALVSSFSCIRASCSTRRSCSSPVLVLAVTSMRFTIPLALQDGSTSRPSARLRYLLSSCVKSPSTTVTVSFACRDSTRCRSVSARRPSISHAMTRVPSFGFASAPSAASCVVLLPGAAHASTTRRRRPLYMEPSGFTIGTRSKRTVAGTHDALSCTTTAPCRMRVDLCRSVRGGRTSTCGRCTSCFTVGTKLGSSSRAPRSRFLKYASTPSTVVRGARVLTRTYVGIMSASVACFPAAPEPPVASSPSSSGSGAYFCITDGSSFATRSSAWRRYDSESRIATAAGSCFVLTPRPSTVS
mmetsp:Transcript_31012/g.95796  ORF Transcript_31012/g.95796 Transcript_31012/m.95796 type:complete len:386 (-) Transcript_31012:39-1196(-)